MENQALLHEINILREENECLKKENEHLKIMLEKYTHSQKEYYEKNKEKIKKNALNRLANLDNEKLRQYRRTAYLNQKEKKKQKELSEINPIV